MNLEVFFNDKVSKPKEKVETLSKELLNGNLKADSLIDFATKSRDTIKASCIEVLEYASKQQPEIVTAHAFTFLSNCLNEKAPRIKWESAKVIGNCCSLYTSKLEPAIHGLLLNSEHTGTVVRWSAAYALGEIVKLKTEHQPELVKALENIAAREEKNSIKKIYMTALKKIK